MKSVVFLSGGIDSTVTLAIALQTSEVHAISFDYGQRHIREIESAIRVAESGRITSHQILPVPLFRFGASTLLKTSPQEPRTEAASGLADTYVPARNTVMIALAAAYADSIGASTIWVGANADDYEGYPDCRPQYFEAFNLTLERGTVSKPTIQTPLVNLKKAEIVGLGDEYGVDFSNTWSCYNPKGDFHCGQCDSCRLRKSAFRDAGVTDPTLYAT